VKKFFQALRAFVLLLIVSYFSAFLMGGGILLHVLGSEKLFHGGDNWVSLIASAAAVGTGLAMGAIILFYIVFLTMWSGGERSLKTYIRTGFWCSAAGGITFIIMPPLWALMVVTSIPATAVFVTTFSWLEGRLERRVL
tara:strand:- start:350 stop:766 length:417 start_codon:yes stop_codon:yes gene_type:complete